MTVTIRRNNWNGTSPGAPGITGISGSLIAVLDYCLTDATYGVGWTKPFSTGSTIAAYKQPAGTNQMYLYIDDTLGTYVRCRGYEVMTSISVGTGLFPTDVQLSGGMFNRKSSAADTTQRPWLFISNGKIFYLFISCASTGGGGSSQQGFAFGDFTSYKAADSYNTIICGQTSSGDVNFGFNSMLLSIASNVYEYVARAYTQVGSSVVACKFSDGVRSPTTAMGAAGSAFPDPVSGGLNIAPVWIGEASALAARGVLPGIWDILHARPLANLDTFSGSGALAGKTFEFLMLQASSCCAIETSDTWA
jgi:hypothetical protein